MSVCPLVSAPPGGWLDLVDVVTDLGADHKYTKLVHDLSDGAVRIYIMI